MRYLDNNGGPILGIVAIIAFIGYLILAYVQPKSGLVTLLQAHGSTAQVVSLAVVLLAALITWGVQKVLFRIRERERLINRNTELEVEAAKVPILEAEAAKVPLLEAEVAKVPLLEAEVAKVPLLEQRIAELEVLIAAMRNQQTQQPVEKNRQ